VCVCVCVCVCVSHPGLLAGRVRFGVAENEPDVFAELDGGLVLPLFERLEDGAEVHGRVHYLEVVLGGEYLRLQDYYKSKSSVGDVWREQVRDGGRPF